LVELLAPAGSDFRQAVWAVLREIPYGKTLSYGDIARTLAKRKGLARSFGHMEGAKTLRKALEYLTEIGVKYLTVYAFSTENWNRPQDEVSTLMKLFLKYIKSERKNMMKNKIRFFVSGRKNNVPEKLQKEIEKLEEETKNNDKITLNIAFNYGSRAEIVDAVNRIIDDGKENITEEDFSKYLYNDFPDPDLVIRTSGEMRISNFLLWQIAYSELYITDTLWPDFNEKEIDKAIESYNQRERRFGGVKNV